MRFLCQIKFFPSVKVSSFFLFLFLLLVTHMLSAGESRPYVTYPKVNPEDFKVLFETANDPMFQHPVNGTEINYRQFDGRGGYEAWKKWPIMSMSKAEILKLIPKQVGLLHLGCPECNAGSKHLKNDFNDNAQLPRQWRDWRWDYKKPEEYYCNKCKEKFPKNKKYPMGKVDVFRNTLNEKIKCPYWLDIAKDKKGFKKRYGKYYLNSQIDYFKQRWAQNNLRKLLDAYILTGDEDFAYKACIIFDAMCDIFPHWLYMSDYAHKYWDYRPGQKMKSTYTRTSSRRGEDKFGPIGMGRAYDILFNSKALKKYSKEIGVDLRAKYLTNIVKFMSPEMFSKEKLADVGLDAWQQGCPGSSGLRTGKLLHDPRYMRRFADHMLRIPFLIYGSDGAYFEGSGYTCLQLNPMMRMRDMNGYSDPKAFVLPEGEKRVENWWYPNNQYEDFYRKSYNIQRELALPDGGAVVYNDAGGSFPSASYIQQTAKPRSFNVMKHGLKHVVLGDGVGEDQIQTHLLFGMDSKHGHSDTMSIQIFAKGHYMLDDITYPKHRARGAYGGIKFHNSGLIDGRGHANGPVGDGKPEFYEPRFNGLAAVRIDGENFYVGNTDIFERTLVNVTIDPKRPYVVDLFRMGGGYKWRELMLLGSYRHRADAKMSLPLKKLPGDRPLMRKGAKWKDEGKDKIEYEDSYGFFSNVRAGAKGKDFKLTYTLKDTWRTKKTKDGKEVPQDLYVDPAKPTVGLVNHFIGMPQATPYLVDLTRRVDKVGPVIKQEQMPQLIFRDENIKDESQFVAIHEPFKGKPSIKKVSRLASDKNTLALQVDFLDGRRDLILMAVDDKKLKYDKGGVKTDAKLAVISRPANGKPNAWMIGGTYLKADGIALEAPQAEYKGKIVKSFRTWNGDEFNGFEITGSTLTPDESLAGAWVMVDNRGMQENLKEKIINNSLIDWYGKYHSRSRKRYQEEKKKHPQSEFVLNWEADQQRWDAAKTAGAGWAFEIKEVIQKDGKTYLITKDDHGLKIDGSTTKELFFPNRELFDAENTWLINSAASTLPMKKMQPKSLIVKPANLAKVKQNLMPYPQDGNGRYRYIKPNKAEDFEAQIIVDETDSEVDKPADSKPGIIHFIGKQTRDNDKRSLSYSGVAGVSEGEMRRYIFKPKGSEQHFKGLLKIPRDGIYTIYYRAGGNGELLVGEDVISPQNRYLGAPYPRIIRLKLKKGYLPLEFWSNMRGSKYWSANNEISWEGPGMSRRPMEFKDFVYSETDLQKIKSKLSVNKLGNDEDSRYQGIKNYVLGAVAYGKGELYLNGKVISEVKDGRAIQKSINLMKGDVLVLKAPKGRKEEGAGIAALYKGKPFFSSTDCRITTTQPGPSFFTKPTYEPGLSKASAAEANEKASKQNKLRFYQSPVVWKTGAETVWLKYVVK